MTTGLERFKEAQERDFATALEEIKGGRKRSNWMWYIFPQLSGLGMTDTSRHYAIKDMQEAIDYLMDEELATRLTEMSKALLKLDTNDPCEIFGSPDDLKLHSSMTLFDAVPATFPVFGRVLDKFYAGKRDTRTLELLKQQKGS